MQVYKLPDDSESIEKRKARLKRPLAVAATALALLGGLWLNTPKPIDGSKVTVTGGNKGEAICDEITNLGERHGVPINRDACLADISRIALADGTVVTIELTNTPVAGMGNGTLGFNVPAVRTSVDDLIAKSREG